MKRIVVYSTQTCPYCRMLKEFLEEKKIPFETIDVGSSREAVMELRKKSGQMGVPVVDIEGTIIVGFEKEKILKALEG